MRKPLFILLLCLITTSASGQFFAPNQKPCLGLQINKGHPLSRGLVGLWLSNEGSGSQVFDLSGNGNHGTFQGTAPSWTAGKFGSAIYLPGTNEYIDCGIVPNSLTNFSLGFWFQRNAGDYAHIGKYFNASSDRSYLLQVYTDNKIYFTVSNTGQSDIYFTSNGTTTDSNWHFLFGVFDGINPLKVYFDGLRIAGNILGVEPASVYDSTASFTIGYYESAGNRYSTGKFDLPIVYSRSVSASEVALLYREPFCMFEPSFNYMLYGAITVAPSGQVIFINHGK